jgi:ketosteroid isomerase-like protein
VGEAREIMDRATEAVVNRDSEALKALYAPDAVAETPDQGTITGHDEIVAYLLGFLEGVVTSHRFYFDSREFLGQLGLAPEPGG